VLAARLVRALWLEAPEGGAAAALLAAEARRVHG
jgi:hypothetical protein